MAVATPSASDPARAITIPSTEIGFSQKRKGPGAGGRSAGAENLKINLGLGRGRLEVLLNFVS